MKKTIVLLLIAFSLNVYAQYPKVDIPGSEIRKITSSIVWTGIGNPALILPKYSQFLFC